MIDQEQPGFFSDFTEQLADARVALDTFARGTARKAAEDVSVSFERAGARIGRALGNAAFGGEASFKRLAKVILEELAKIALDKIFSGAGGAKTDIPFFGARAAGGSVNTGGAYLVGERGPELFMPRQAGEIGAASSGAVNVHFHFAEGSDAASVSRHQGQIAAQVARAVAYGRRNL